MICTLGSINDIAMSVPVTSAMRQFALRVLRIGVTVWLPVLAAGCVTASTMDAASPPPGGPVALSVHNCIDRTQAADRNLGEQATAAFVDALNKSQAFRVDPAAPYALTCDVSNFLEGSAFKRWLMPGWGATVGQVAAMITDSRTGATVLIVRGNATVSSGGLYTIGAETYILRTAIDDAVLQMTNWARGRPTAAQSDSHAFPGKATS